jgi:hypothetical protein
MRAIPRGGRTCLGWQLAIGNSVRPVNFGTPFECRKNQTFLFLTNGYNIMVVVGDDVLFFFL